MGRTDGAILYHYTDFLALDGILRAGQLRVNNVLRMNDSAEMRHFMTRLCTAVTRQLTREGLVRQASEAQALFEAEVRREFSAFAACFSFQRDDAAQWERYADQGRGVCIAFRREHLAKIAQGPLSLQRVFYQNDMAGHPMVGVFCRLAEAGLPLTGESPAVRQALNDAWACSVAFKHPSFASEDEMRLVVSPFGKGQLDIQPCYHVSRERIKKYYPLDLAALCAGVSVGLEELVAEILIGPESPQSKVILEDYLRDSGLPRLAGQVSLSDCPLRTLPRG